MKVANFVFKIAALILSIAALVCCILGNLERISTGFSCLKDRLGSKNVCRCTGDAECDYEDWDI